MVYIVELNEGYDRSSILHYGKCGKPRVLHNLVILDTKCSKEEIINSDAVKYVDEDVKLKQMMFRTTNWGLSSYDLVELSNVPLGTGVNIYIHDTGISRSLDFGNRVRTLYRPFLRIRDKSHGTAVASMAAGRYHGIAPKSNIIDVETNLWTSDILKGYEMILMDHQRPDNNNPSVLNMSYGGYRLSPTIFTALEALAKSGIVIVGAAGNERRNFSAEPASSPYVISVGSIDKRNSISYFSNRGTGVDIYAAGQDVILANGLNQTSTQIWNGTSFSSPLVAGICANIMQGKPKPRSWDDVLNVRKQILNSTMRINPSILKNIISSQSLDLSNENIDNIDNGVETDEFIDNFDDNSKYQYEDDNRDVHPCNECCGCDDNNDLTYLYFILFVVIVIALVFLYFHQRNKNVRGLTNIRNVKNNIMY